MTTSTGIKGLHHTGLSVSNLERAIAHYENDLGFRSVARFGVEDSSAARRLLDVDDAGAEVALLQNATGYIELFEYKRRPQRANAPQVYDAGIRHICIQAIDVDNLFDVCMTAGGTSHARPSGLGTGALYAYIRDAEENIMELEGVPWGPQGQGIPWFAHTAFVTHDLDRLTEFYEKLVGVAVHDRQSFGPHRAFDRVAGVEGVVFDGAWIKLANATLEFWQYYEPETNPAKRPDVRALGWNHVCFEVDDIEASYHQLKSDGVELHGPAIRNQFGAFFYGRDPDGNVFECLEISKTAQALSVDELSGLAFLSELEDAFAANYSRD